MSNITHNEQRMWYRLKCRELQLSNSYVYGNHIIDFYAYRYGVYIDYELYVDHNLVNYREAIAFADLHSYK